MVLFIILGAVVLIAIVVLGVLFFMLGNEGKKKEASAVPVTDLNQLKKELSSGGLLDPVQKPKFVLKNSEVIPPFVPKVSLPTQKVQSPLGDDAYKKRAEELEEELKSIAQKAEGQSDEAKKMIEDLVEENESLKSQKDNLEQAQQKLTELQGEAVSLQTENAGLQSQLQTTNAQVRLLEEQMTSFKLQMGEEISRANAAVVELTKEKETLSAAVPIPVPEPDAVLHQELEALKIQQAQLRQRYDDLERTHEKLRELNTTLMEKNDLLQYEVVKSRAQSSGLERVSFNYKNQLEDFLKKVNAAEVTSDHLSQVKNRLEETVEQIKLQNEELVKKDQLVQFELEKNRSRLISLERENEDLKARAQQKDQP
jgi:chromosome segregation ATPase